jgi:hypothetical protein
MSEGPDGSPDGLDPQEAFQMFAHELRLEILLALWEAPGYSLPFADLRRAVDERDSGKFTYHLGKLRGQFVKRVGERYVLQYAGHRVIDAVRSGVFHESPSVDSVEIDGTCPRCGTSPTFEYGNHLATVACPSCDRKLVEYPFDPGGFQDRSLAEVVAAFDRRSKYKWRSASGGVCFVCAGRVDVTYVGSVAGLDHLDRYDDYFAADHPALLDLSCRNCSFYSYLPVGVRLLDHPSVVGRLAERGVDVDERPLWGIPFLTEADRVTVRGREPWSVLVEAPTPAGPLEVVLDDAAAVESVTTRP